MNYVRCRYKAPDKLVERNTSPGPMADDLAEKIGIVKARLSQLLSTVLTDLRFDLTTLSWL
ncbi:MAG: hypothetical protein HYW48_06580 [Deltaproteobacteria bacterium]|nr:hypothetical protein [Deltaproteobacteria bacterium]